MNTIIQELMLAIWVVTYTCTNCGKFKFDIKSGMLAAKQMLKELDAGGW